LHTFRFKSGAQNIEKEKLPLLSRKLLALLSKTGQLRVVLNGYILSHEQCETQIKLL